MSELAYREAVDRPWLERLPHSPVRYAAGVLGLAGLYYAGAKTGFLLEFSGPIAAIVWLPVGVAISFLYLGGLAYWPGVLIGDLLANNYSLLPLGSALGQTCGNVLEVVIVVWLLRRLVRHGSPLGSPRGVGAIALSIAAGAAVSATVGTMSLLSGGVIGIHGLAPSGAPGCWAMPPARCSSCRWRWRGTSRCRKAGGTGAGSRPLPWCSLASRWPSSPRGAPAR